MQKQPGGFILDPESEDEESVDFHPTTFPRANDASKT